MNVVKVPVELGERSYTIYVGEGLFEQLDEYVRAGGWRKAAIVTDSGVGPLYAHRLEDALEGSGVSVFTVEVERGERSKNVEVATGVIDTLLENEVGRSDLVVAVGGGVVGDLAGFVASIYKRGLSLLQVPTTLMAQVDSAIGGKAGVDLPAGKNLVGAFHQPVAVISDVGLLATLPEREFASGLAEVVKYSFLRPGAFEAPHAWKDGRLGATDTAALIDIVSRCAGVKAELVSADEQDTGIRAILNYGHTLGHALEAASGYAGAYSHGEAVSVGMVYAATVAEAMEVCEPGLAERHRQRLDSLGLPTRPVEPIPGFDRLLEAMAHDKKNRKGVTMVLLEKEGRPLVLHNMDARLLERSYELL